jgi:pantetheine-phosphate adenylyltransferase
MRRGMIAGSFDPITHGHTWMIEQAAQLVDKLYVVVGNNPAKKYMFNANDRMDMVNNVCDRVCGVGYTALYLPHDQLLIDMAKEHQCDILIRGIRNNEDYNYEAQLRLINRRISPEIETIFLMPPRELSDVSSSAVKGLVGCGNWRQIVSEYVDPYVMTYLESIPK